MKIFFDLDGTLIDASERLYKLFCYLVPECKFSKEEYWELKRNKVNHQIILEKYFTDYDFNEFNNKWMDLIEADEYLKLDKLYPDVISTLDILKQKNSLFILTARQFRQKTIRELKRFGIYDYFEEIFVTENKKTKLDLLKNLKLYKDDVFISDMGKDIETVKKTNIKLIALTWGFMNRENLINYKPDYIFDEIRNIVNIVV